MCLMTIFEGTWSNNGIATALTRAMGLFKNSGYQTIRSCGEFSLMRKKCRTWWSSIAVDSMKVHHVQTNPNCPELDQIGRINWQLQLKSEAEHQELSVNYISFSDIIYIIYNIYIIIYISRFRKWHLFHPIHPHHPVGIGTAPDERCGRGQTHRTCDAWGFSGDMLEVSSGSGVPYPLVN